MRDGASISITSPHWIPGTVHNTILVNDNSLLSMKVQDLIDSSNHVWGERLTRHTFDGVTADRFWGSLCLISYILTHCHGLVRP